MKDTAIRWRTDTGFESRCQSCREWWPLTVEFWMTARGLARCRACYLEIRRGGRVGMPGFRSPAAAARRRLRDNAYKAAQWADPEKRPALLERQRQTQLSYYRRKRPEVLARTRAAYVQRVGHEPTPGMGRPRIAI